MVQAICSGPELGTTASHSCKRGKVLNPSTLQKDRQAADRRETSLSQPSPSLAAGCFSDGDLHREAFEALLELGRGKHTSGASSTIRGGFI